MRQILIVCSLMLVMMLSTGISNAISINPVKQTVSEPVATTVTTTTKPIRTTIKDIRDHLKSYGPLRNLRNKIRNLFNQDKTPYLTEVTE